MKKDTALLAAADVMNYVFLRECFNSKYESTIVHEGVLDFFTQMSEEDIYYEPFKDACETEFEEGEYALGTLEETLEALKDFLAANWGSAFSENLFVYRFYKKIVEDYFAKKNSDVSAQITEPTRDEILEPFFVECEYFDGRRRFEGLDKETLKVLLAKGYIDSENSQNGSPVTSDFLDFMGENKAEVTAHGYAISEERSDSRVTLEGVLVNFTSLPLEEKTDSIISFYDLCRGADVCEVDMINNTAYAWWS